MKKVFSLLLAIITALTLLAVTISADVGPKESVNVKFKNMIQGECYCTLLSETKGTGPYNVYEGDNYKGNDIETAFHQYNDSDGFYYLEFYQQIDIGKKFCWGYHPPNTFKVLLYFPKTDSFAVSGIIKVDSRICL